MPFQMSQRLLGEFMDETIPGKPVPIPGIQKINNHYFSDSDWSPPHVDDKTRALLGLKHGDDAATSFHNKKAVLEIKPGQVGDHPNFRCRECKRAHSDPDCKIICYRRLKRKFNIATRKLEIRQTDSVGNGNHTTVKSKRKNKTPPVYGIFVKAGQTIEKNEFVGEYLGKIVTAGYEGPTLWSDYVYTLDEGDNKWERDAKHKLYPVEIDSQYVGNWTRFMNHHCNPNVDAMDTQAGKIRMMAFQANRTINANEEVFINYGTNYFTGRGWQCRCPQHPEPHAPVSKSKDDTVETW